MEDVWASLEAEKILQHLLEDLPALLWFPDTSLACLLPSLNPFPPSTWLRISKKMLGLWQQLLQQGTEMHTGLLSFPTLRHHWVINTSLNLPI